MALLIRFCWQWCSAFIQRVICRCLRFQKLRNNSRDLCIRFSAHFHAMSFQKQFSRCVGLFIDCFIHDFARMTAPSSLNLVLLVVFGFLLPVVISTKSPSSSFVPLSQPTPSLSFSDVLNITSWRFLPTDPAASNRSISSQNIHSNFALHPDFAHVSHDQQRRLAVSYHMERCNTSKNYFVSTTNPYAFCFGAQRARHSHPEGLDAAHHKTTAWNVLYLHFSHLVVLNRLPFHLIIQSQT